MAFCRGERKIGGSAIFVRNGLSIGLFSGEENIVLSIYRVPGGRKEEKECFSNRIEDILNIVMFDEEYNVFISGDFNIDLLTKILAEICFYLG